MILSESELEEISIRYYTNKNCINYDEFLEDLNVRIIARRLTKKISKGNSKNLRLLTNHIISFTNNFEIRFAKEALLMDTEKKESAVIKTILLYLGHLKPNEYTSNDLDLETIQMLKDMDKNA